MSNKELAIAHLCRDIYFPLVANVHLLHGDYPALNEVTESAGQRHTATARIKLLAVGSRKGVDLLTRRLAADGYTVTSGPRTTCDGYYESSILGPEGIQIEVTE